MNNRDWERFGEDIRRTIQDAVEYGNYDRLNQTISNTVNQAADWVNRNKNEFMNYTRTGGQPTYKQPVYRQPENKVQQAGRFKVNTSFKVAGILYTIFGSLLSLPFLILALFVLIGGTVTADFDVIFWVWLISSLIFLGGFGGMALNGILKLTKWHRFNLYKKEIGNSELCNISVLSSSVGKSTSYVEKDVEKMIQKGWFRQGHMDKQKTCLIVTDKMYHQYQQLEQERELQEKIKQEKEEHTKGIEPEVREIIDRGDAYVKKIRECNDAIPGEEISEKIYHIELVVDKIFDRVEQQPETVADITKLMDYYLPTTVKLLEAYAQMDAQPVGGENIQSAKREIESTLDTLNEAFEKLLDGLFQDAAWDVSSDISVLNTMLAQEGLKGDGLKK